jgi:hypothetical protein
MSAGDYRLFRSENAQNRSPETGGQFAKDRHWRAFLRASGTVSPSAGLPGWGGRIRTSAWWIKILYQHMYPSKPRVFRCGVFGSKRQKIGHFRAELTGFPARMERCYGDLERLTRALGSALPGTCLGGAEVVRRMAPHKPRGPHDQAQTKAEGRDPPDRPKDR